MGQFNLNWLFGLPKINDYLNLVINFWDVLVLGLTIYLIIKNFRIASLVYYIIVGIFLIIQISFIHTFPEMWHFGIELNRFILWVFLLYKYYKCWKMWSIIAFFSLFDHFLISQSLPVLLVWFFFESFSQSKSTWKLKIFFVYLTLNAFVASFQTISGQSLGMKWLGESVLDVHTIGGIAKQNLFGHMFLRGYGLLPHPNMTGFLGVIGLFLFETAKGKTKIFGVLCTFILLILSFSRAAWIAAILYFLSTRIKFKVTRLQTKHILAIFTLVLGISIFSLTRQDFYRTDDLMLWLNSYSHLDIWHIIFGIGLGQYPYLLQSHNSLLEFWQWQPAHNVWLNLIIEVGIAPIFVILGIFLKDLSKIKSPRY